MNKKVNVYLMYIIVFLQGFVFYGPIATLYRQNRNLSLLGISGCDIALIYSSINKEESEKVFGIYSAFSTGGYLIASFMYGVFVKQSMDSTAFYTIIPYAVAAILTAFKNTSIIILVISFALINEVVQVVGIFLNQSQYLRSGIDIKYFGILAVVMQIVKLISVKSYKVSAKLGDNRSIEILYIIIAICCTILVFTSNGTLTILSIMLIFGSTAIISPIVLNIENKSINTSNRATILSIFSMFGSLASSGANVIVGKTTEIPIS
jgi:MFS family permease